MSRRNAAKVFKYPHCQITHKLLELKVDIVSNLTVAIDSLDVSDSSAVHLYTIKKGATCSS